MGPSKSLFSTWAAVSLCAVLAACAAVGSPAASVSGTATYRERMALPAGAVFEASIEDVSRADAPATVIGRTLVEVPGQVPIRFSIGYEPAQLQPNHRYVLRARIMVGNNLLFTTDTGAPVLGASGVTHVDLLLRRAGAGAAPSPGGPAAPAARRMRGMYTYMADAAVFVDCATGNRLQVAQEGDNAALQSAYVAARPTPGAALLATVDARVLMRPSMEAGQAARPTLVVERFVAVSPEPLCGPGATAASLENTYWKLLALHGKPVDVAEKQREPHLILQPAQKRVAGSGGCNRLAGSYSLDGDRLSFGRTAGTMMACPQGMEQERAFLDALSAVARWRVDGQRLELLDERGGTIAQFESRYMR